MFFSLLSKEMQRFESYITALLVFQCLQVKCLLIEIYFQLHWNRSQDIFAAKQKTVNVHYIKYYH